VCFAKTCTLHPFSGKLPHHFVINEANMRGGWRFGAGRPAIHDKVESYLQIDIRRWERNKCVCASGHFREQWHQDGKTVASIDVRVESADRLTLIHRWEWNGIRQDESFPVSLANTPCHFGGERSWFICPHCNQRTATLYLAPGGWQCQKSLGLAYASQSETAFDRLRRKKAKLEEKLNDMLKPKGMHKATYERLKKRWVNVEIAWQEVFAAQAARKTALL
jgi:hypothetical protein